MVNFQLEGALGEQIANGFAMNELFHTEDCGISLICRCCRGPVYAQRLTRAERVRVQRELWSREYRRAHHSSPIGHAKRYLEIVAAVFPYYLIASFIGVYLFKRTERHSQIKKTLETTKRRNE